MTLFLLVFWPVLIVLAAIYVWLHARILRRAGHSRLWSLAMLLPGVNVVLIWVFAFADWPALRTSKAIPEIFE
ncbi:MAG TPA: hypothetical protein EYH07_12770 [Kiloniellaceae bacterium]|nr:hypothetical protein [Kiloniellaceae bacterium]HIP79321.1 hypothetical protein [Kiloniellaceae bacterium]